MFGRKHRSQGLSGHPDDWTDEEWDDYSKANPTNFIQMVPGSAGIPSDGSGNWSTVTNTVNTTTEPFSPQKVDDALTELTKLVAALNETIGALEHRVEDLEQRVF